LFSTPQAPQPGQDILWTLAGSVFDTANRELGIVPTARRNEFGWFAQLTQIL
jgi:hypothetical protein